MKFLPINYLPKKNKNNRQFHHPRCKQTGIDGAISGCFCSKKSRLRRHSFLYSSASRRSITNKGFSLIELLLYISISSILLLAVSSFLGILLQARVKNQTIAEVEQQGIQIIQLITQSIRNASGINSPTAGATASTLSLDVTTAGDDPTVFDLNGSIFRITEGTNPSVPLTNSRIAISSLDFQNLSRVDTPGIMRVSFDISHINPEGRNEYTYNKSFSVSASLRGGSASPPVSDTTAPSAISNLALSGATSNSFDLSWTSSGDDGNTGTATSYDIRYALSSIIEANWGSATEATGEPTPQIAGSAEVMTVTGLTASTTYYFAIKTSDEVSNISAISNSPNLSTLAIPAQADSLTIDTSGSNIGGGGNKELKGITVENTGASDITIDKITLTWTNGQLIEEIKIDNNRIWKHNNEGSPNGRQPTGTEIDVVDYIITSGTTDNVDKFKFNGNMTGDTFTITATMGDGSTKVIGSFSP